MSKAKPSLRETQVRFARFLVVGATAYGVQLVVINLAGRIWPVYAAFTASFVLATATHYSLNRFWALPSARTDAWRQAREYLMASLVSYGVNLLGFHFCLAVLGLSKTWAAAWAVPPSTVVVFLLLNYRVFRATPV